MGSVCDGAFILASAGILDGKRAATHWYSCERLARLYPRVQVDREAIFVRDGRIWTAAGVSTGIDMALAMVEEDHGRRLADTVASHLVLFARRPGFQSQFSEELVAQTLASDPLGPVIAWMRANLRAPLDVATVAHRAGMSVRTLHRTCLDALDLTPAKLVEKLRVEHARSLLTTTRLGTKVVASRSGFGSTPRMTRAFQRALGVTPGAYRLMFSRDSGGHRALRARSLGASEPRASGSHDEECPTQRACSPTTSISVVFGPETVPLVVMMRRVIVWWPGGSGLKRMKYESTTAGWKRTGDASSRRCSAGSGLP